MSSDLEFVYQLRDTVTEYLRTVDAWERKHAQYYRLPSQAHKVTADLAEEQQQFQDARRKLEALMPRARILYSRHDLRDPFGMLLNVNLGAAAPQSGFGSAIGGNERTEVARGLVDLLACCAPTEPARTSNQPVGRSLWRRVYDFFF